MRGSALEKYNAKTFSESVVIPYGHANGQVILRVTPIKKNGKVWLINDSNFQKGWSDSLIGKACELTYKPRTGHLVIEPATDAEK